MRTVDELEVSYPHLERPRLDLKPGLIEKLERRKILVLAVLTLAAFCVRAYQLDAVGLAEDETNKMFAIRSYEQGDFTANADHPMVMKMLCYGSLHLAGAWNASVGNITGMSVSEETALRMPNALFGALTVIPLLLFASSLFGFRTGLVASLLWAFGLNAVWINRVGKEDTLLVFFMLTAYHLYNRAKRLPESDVAGQERLYALAGAAFGLMLASKYFLHYFGLNALFYYLAGYDSRNNRALTRRMWLKFFGAMILAFVAFNPAAFLPKTWRYLLEFVSENLVTHHGYPFMDGLYHNELSAMTSGMPWYFYFLFLTIKLPLPLLLAFAVGLVELFRHRGDPEVARGYLFLRMMLLFWLLPMSLVGSKFLRYTLTFMPLLYMTAAVGIVVIWRMASRAVKKMKLEPRIWPRAAAVAVALIFVLAPAITTVRSLPYPSLYLNALGGGHTGYYFPHDEFYDLGARESIKHVAETAPEGASLASEIPGVVQYYLERYNRPDIRSEIISHPKFDLLEDPPDYILLQRGRLYFENLEEFKLIERSFSPEQASSYLGADAARVYRLDRARLNELHWAKGQSRRHSSMIK
ncbi:MAG TPA: glycosyltransferase family 39 protein [Blastocatellia bacterium]|nr:glycosyltransferase family 39 protein [Blastocatellia bacterium]